MHIGLDQLAENRCCFIAGCQQYHGTVRELHGAYLIYDNEEKHMVYQLRNDYNSARERVGMGLLIARYLRQGRADEGRMLEKSLKQYTEYVLRELVDPQTGQVFNDMGRDDSYKEKRAEDSRRGVLPLIFPDGTASCAYLYPHNVNGIRAGFYAPYANDQDWGLYFYLCALSEQ